MSGQRSEWAGLRPFLVVSTLILILGGACPSYADILVKRYPAPSANETDPLSGEEEGESPKPKADYQFFATEERPWVVSKRYGCSGCSLSFPNEDGNDGYTLQRHFESSAENLRLYTDSKRVLATQAGALIRPGKGNQISEALEIDTGSRRNAQDEFKIHDLAFGRERIYLATTDGLVVVKEVKSSKGSSLALDRVDLEDEHFIGVLESNSKTIWAATKKQVYVECDADDECPSPVISGGRRWQPVLQEGEIGKTEIARLVETGQYIWIMRSETGGAIPGFTAAAPLLVTEKNRIVYKPSGPGPGFGAAIEFQGRILLGGTHEVHFLGPLFGTEYSSEKWLPLYESYREQHRSAGEQGENDPTADGLGFVGFVVSTKAPRDEPREPDELWVALKDQVFGFDSNRQPFAVHPAVRIHSQDKSITGIAATRKGLWINKDGAFFELVRGVDLQLGLDCFWLSPELGPSREWDICIGGNVGLTKKEYWPMDGLRPLEEVEVFVSRGTERPNGTELEGSGSWRPFDGFKHAVGFSLARRWIVARDSVGNAVFRQLPVAIPSGFIGWVVAFLGVTAVFLVGKKLWKALVWICSGSWTLLLWVVSLPLGFLKWFVGRLKRLANMIRR